MKSTWTLAAVLGASILAGCMGGGDNGDAPTDGADARDESFRFTHAEASEITRITLQNAPTGLTYADLTITVDGKTHSFGEFATFDTRRFQVDAKKDAAAPVEAGDVISVIASGTVNVRILDADQELGAFEANIPDNKAPSAPTILEPDVASEGVSRLPTFRWNAVADPAGVSYALVYSAEPAMALPLVTVTVDGLTAANYAVGAGKELLAGQTYYWHVKAVDGADNASPWSETGQFKTA